MERTQKKKTSKPYSPVAWQCIENAREGEFCEGAVRLLVEHRDDYQSEAAALTAIAGKLGCSPDSRSVLGAPRSSAMAANDRGRRVRRRRGSKIWSARTASSARPAGFCVRVSQ